MLKRDQENGMNGFGITNASRRTILAMPEAAAFLGCTVDDLLLKGAVGELRICARVPEDAVVYSTNKGLIDLASHSLTGLERKLHEDHAIDMSALAVRDVQFVVLRKSDCASAVAQGEAYQSLFATGVSIGPDGFPAVVEPLPPKNPAGLLDSRPFRTFACYPSAVDPNNRATRRTSAPVRLRLTIDTMRILHADLVALNAVASEAQRFDIGFVEEPHMPRTLVKLYEAALTHWDCSRPGWTPPEPMSVERTLQELNDYKGKLAEAGATLLRRSFASWNQRHYELRKADGKITPFESLVVVASAWKTSAGSKGDAENESAKYRDKAKAFEYWLSFDIKEYLAKYAWQIVAPKHARSTGRPRSK
jgi:hypothetical protein